MGGARPASAQAHLVADADARPGPGPRHGYAPLASQSATHKTGIPIAALDASPDRRCAILAGKEMLKTVRIEAGKVTEEFNLRAAISSFASAHSALNTEARAAKRRDFLPASDVKWSHGSYDTTVATAANHGRIALYDLRRPEVEHAWLHEHTRAVHKLAFNPHQGYYLVSASHDGSCKGWDLRTLAGERAALTTKSFRQFQGRAEAVRDVRWSPTDAFEFVVGTDAGAVMLWDMRKASAPKLRLNGHDKACAAVDWHPDGKHVVSAGLDKSIKVFNLHRDDRRQKPAWHIRASQAVMNVRWRPAAWSADGQGTGQWQSTQLVTTYSQDPRVHVWDLRRPSIPVRELDRYNTPAADILWASKDLLWMVGNEGMFTQSDVAFAPPGHRDISPCTVDWFPNGAYAVFAEDGGTRRAAEGDDPARAFLNLRHEQRGSGDGAAVTPNLSDEEGDQDGFFGNSFRRRQSKGAASRSVKSRASSPPYKDELPLVLPLDKAVSERTDLVTTSQVGVIGEMPGATMAPAVVQYLAEQYAQPATEAEQTAHPETTLDRLHNAFRVNADASDAVAMYRLGQSWRMLGAVIIPELRDWADQNRHTRRAKAKEAAHRTSPSVTHTAGPASLRSPRSPAAEKPLTGLVKSELSTAANGASALRSLRRVGEQESTSTVTTPLARPLSDSIQAMRGQSAARHPDLDDEFDAIPELTPSIIASHSAAAAASKALREDESGVSDSPPSSPEARRRGGDNARKSHRRTRTTDSVPTASSWLLPRKSTPQAIQGRSPHRRPDYISPNRHSTEEDRLAARRDHRTPSWSLWTAPGTPGHEARPRPVDSHRHNSNESFLMFSASTDSSHQAQSFGTSLNSPESSKRPSTSLEDWQNRKDSFEPSSPPSDESGRKGNLSRIFGPSASDPSFDPTFPMDGPTTPELGLDGQAASHLRSEAWSTSSESRQAGGKRYIDPEVSIASTPDEPFHFEAPDRKPRPLRHPQTTTLRHPPLPLHAAGSPPMARATLSAEESAADSPHYLASDFRPVDPSAYSPKSPYAWSARPLIAHAIAFDLESGQACGQFSAHLLMHVYPFFFSPPPYVRRNSIPPGPASGRPCRGVAEKLLSPPPVSSRLIESIFTSHFLFLMKMRLYVPMAELRNLGQEFGFKNIFDFTSSNDTDRDGEDPYLLFVTCVRCRTPMHDGASMCKRCSKVRDTCPICWSVKYASNQADGMLENGKAGGKAMWAFCQSCGHSAHRGCMDAWLSHEYSHGQCPTRGCGCDCAPGAVRRERLGRQIQEEEDAKLITGKGVSGRSGSPRVKDEKEGPKRVGESRAVERTRRVLRESGTQSGDERLMSRRDSRGSVGGLSQGPSQKKTVRVMTPGEESSRKESGYSQS